MSVAQILYNATQIMTADDCAYRHYLRDIAGVKVNTRAVNLVFGTCVDEVIREYLTALSLGQPPPDTVERFAEVWRDWRRREVIRYASTQTPEQYERMGRDLMRELPEAWERTGFQVALDAEGIPLIQRELKARLVRGSRQVRIKGTLDVAVYTPRMRLAILDAKSAVTSHTALYTLRSDQLTMYQLLLAVHGESLGLPPVEELGFWDLIKRKDSSHFEDPVLVPVRSDEEIADFIDKIFWRAEDDERARFPKASRYQHNTPCEECEFASYCTEGESEGLTLPKDWPSVSSQVRTKAFSV